MRPGSALRIASSVALAAVLGLALLLAVLPGGESAEERSVYSVANGGRRAAFRLLDALGWSVEAWTRAPGLLPSDGHLLFLGGVPDDPPGYGDVAQPEEGGAGAETAPLRPPGSRRLRDPLHYLRFIEEGGTLVVPFTDEHAKFLAERLGFAELATLQRERRPLPSDAPAVPIRLASGETLEGHGAELWFRPLDVSSPLRVIAAGPYTRAMILAERVGHGTLVLLASDRFLDNEFIDCGDNALLLVRLIEELRPTGQIFFDEYSLGGWVPESPLELALAPETRGFSLHLLALAFLGFWSLAWVRQFPRDPEPLEQLSPLDRARAHAGWIAAVGRFDLLARMLRIGVLRRLAQRGGSAAQGLELVAAAPAEPAEAERAAPAERPAPALDEGVARAVLAPFAGRLGGEPGLAQALELLVGRAVRDEDELERLAREIARLEAALGAPVAEA